MPNALELRNVIKLLRKYGIIYMTGKGRHPKVFDSQTKRSYPVTAHGQKTMILSYALGEICRLLHWMWLPAKFELPNVDTVLSPEWNCWVSLALHGKKRYSSDKNLPVLFMCL